MYDNQRKRKMKKYILFALISLCFWGCSEDEIKPYHGGQYLYFSQLKEFGDEDFEVSFNNYPTSNAIIVKIGLGLIGKPFSIDTPYKVSVVAEDESEDKIKNAVAGVRLFLKSAGAKKDGPCLFPSEIS